MFTRLHIEYANPADLSDTVVLDYRLRDNPVTARWVKKVLQAQEQYAIDDPGRFYGFGSLESQQQDALNRINQCITVFKLDYSDIAGGYITDVADQESLNYWHHVFEIYHGLLDNQPEGEALLPVLADLNIAVHRCESVARGAFPRHVVTWYGLPKTDMLTMDDYRYFENAWSAGTVLLNYAEIGKTMLDLAVDRDSYIGQKAFQPFRHYSADFVVQMYDKSLDQAQQEMALARQYHFENSQRFGSWQTCYQPGSVPVADLTSALDLSIIETHQYVKSVIFT